MPDAGDDASAAQLALLHGLQDRFLGTVRTVDPEVRVPWCGRWRARHVVVHLGRIHHWAAGQARRRQETPLGRGPFVLDEFYATHAEELRSTLADLGPDAPAWTLDASGVARFWFRRQTHETLVHLWDVRAAAGLPLGLEDAPWDDTVDEAVTVMQPRQVHLGRMPPLPARIRLQATDVPRRWDLHAAHEAPPGPAVVVEGPAQDLALLLWRRVPADHATLTVTGDRGALDAALAERLVP